MANISLLKIGVYIVEFDDSETIIQVMEAGPWYLDAKPLFVKPWTREVSLEREGLSVVLMWVKLPGLKLHLWSPNMLSKIASIIGKPLFTDMMTANKSRLAYARICVEISMEGGLPDSVPIREQGGQCFQQRVEYEWVPTQCKHCNVFGHIENKCPKKHVMKQIWKVKENMQAVTIDNASKVCESHEAANKQIIQIEEEHVITSINVHNSTMQGTDQSQVGQCSTSNAFAGLEGADQILTCQRNNSGKLTKKQGVVSSGGKNTNHRLK